MTRTRLGLTLLCLAAPSLGCLQTLDEAVIGSSGSGTGGSSSGTGSTSATGTSGGTAGQICANLLAGLDALSTNFPGCNVGQSLGMTPTLAQCVADIGVCTAADLVDLQTFLTCVNAAAPVNCTTDPNGLSAVYAELVPCLGSYQMLSNACQTAIKGGAATTTTSGTGTTSGIGTTTGSATSSGSSSGTSSSGASTSTGGGSVAFCGGCSSDNQCGGSNACVAEPQTGGTHCGQDCSLNQQCPAGSQCEFAIDQSGNQVQQCRPSSCALGIDECSSCQVDRDCGQGNICFQGGCALNCNQNQLCPGTSACQQASTQGGRQTFVCISSTCPPTSDGGAPLPDAGFDGGGTGSGDCGADGGGRANQTCSDLVSAEGYVSNNFPGCTLSAVQTSIAGCESGTSACSSSDLSEIDAYLLCIEGIAPVNCTNDPGGALQVQASFLLCFSSSGSINVPSSCFNALVSPDGG